MQIWILYCTYEYFKSFVSIWIWMWILQYLYQFVFEYKYSWSDNNQQHTTLILYCRIYKNMCWGCAATQSMWVKIHQGCLSCCYITYNSSSLKFRVLVRYNKLVITLCWYLSNMIICHFIPKVFSYVLVPALWDHPCCCHKVVSCGDGLISGCILNKKYNLVW